MLKTLLKYLPLRQRPGLKPPYQYSEDLFADTRMSFGEHIEDLRKHLLRAIYGFVIGLIFGFIVGKPVLDFITKPVTAALRQYYLDYAKKHPTKVNPLIDEVSAILKANADARRVDPNLAESELAFLNEERPLKLGISPGQLDQAMRKTYPQLFGESGLLKDVPPPGKDLPAIPLDLEARPLEFINEMGPALGLIGKRSTLTSLSVQEAFMVYMMVSILTGLVIASPWIIYQIWAFVAAGLYPHERKYATAYLPLSILLFLGGIYLCEFWVIPAALKVLLEFNEWLGFVDPDPRLNEWLGLAILLPLIFGLSFQLPLVMLFMTKIGVFTPESYTSKRRIAILFIAFFAAGITPTPDPITMMLLMVPMILLYELGIWLARWSYRTPSDKWEDHEETYTPDASA